MGRAGVVEAHRGLGGGFELARPLGELTVLEVINAVDPVRRIDRCPLNDCDREALCPLHSRLDEGLALIEALYGGTTIAELVAKPQPDHSLCVATSSPPPCLSDERGEGE